MDTRSRLSSTGTNLVLEFFDSCTRTRTVIVTQGTVLYLTKTTSWRRRHISHTRQTSLTTSPRHRLSRSSYSEQLSIDTICFRLSFSSSQHRLSADISSSQFGHSPEQAFDTSVYRSLYAVQMPTYVEGTTRGSLTPSKCLPHDQSYSFPQIISDTT